MVASIFISNWKQILITAWAVYAIVTGNFLISGNRRPQAYARVAFCLPADSWLRTFGVHAVRLAAIESFQLPLFDNLLPHERHGMIWKPITPFRGCVLLTYQFKHGAPDVLTNATNCVSSGRNRMARPVARRSQLTGIVESHTDYSTS
jgi:hypothetical protein